MVAQDHLYMELAQWSSHRNGLAAMQLGRYTMKVEENGGLGRAPRKIVGPYSLKHWNTPLRRVGHGLCCSRMGR